GLFRHESRVRMGARRQPDPLDGRQLPRGPAVRVVAEAAVLRRLRRGQLRRAVCRHEVLPVAEAALPGSLVSVTAKSSKPVLEAQASTSAILAKDLGKMYPLYKKPLHQLIEAFLPRKKLHREFWAVRNVYLDVARGSTVGIIG